MQGKVWGVQSAETGELVLYPREHPPLIKISADVAALWHEVAVSSAICRFDYTRWQATVTCLMSNRTQLALHHMANVDYQKIRHCRCSHCSEISCL